MYTKWDILWKPLLFRLKHNIVIIDTMCRLHNFINEYNCSRNIASDKSIDHLDHELVNFLSTGGNDFVGIFSDEESTKKQGRSHDQAKVESNQGRDLRIFFS